MGTSHACELPVAKACGPMLSKQTFDVRIPAPSHVPSNVFRVTLTETCLAPTIPGR